MIIEKLNWDSDFFERRIGRLLIDDETEFVPAKFIEEAKESYDLIYVFSIEKMLSFNKVKAANLDMVDIIITMSVPFSKTNYSKNGYEFRTSLTKEELIGCYEIAEQTSVVSRFYTDALIGEEKTKALYRKWIDNSINHSFSDGLFLEKDENKVIGIHLIKTLAEKNTGMFTLTGLNTNYKGKGLGRKLWEQSYAYWADIGGIEIIKSPFSFQNKESLNFHLKMGFNKIEETKYIYHYRNL